MFGHAYKILLVLMLLAVAASCGSLQTQNKSAVMPEIQPGSLVGYLKPDALPDSLDAPSSASRPRLGGVRAR